jgi:hypothetical protein
MHETYHVDRSSRRRRLLRRAIFVVVVVAVIVGAFFLNTQLHSDTTINQGQPTVTKVDIAEPKTKTVTEPTFKIDLPENWKAGEPADHADYHWDGTDKLSIGRALDIYVDSVPSDMAFNRLLPLEAQDDRIVPVGDISENCVNFTDDATIQPSTLTAPSKWAGVNFICDMGNKFRNVIGISSAEGLNYVTVGGARGSHRYTFVYTDHGARPSESVFLAMIRSFQAL